MISLPDREAIQAALNSPLPQSLKTILTAINGELWDFTYVAIIGANDTEHAIEQEIGFSPLIHPIDQIRYGQPGFEPYWAHLSHHPGWFELSHPAGNSGFAFVLLIEDAGDSELLEMCRQYAR